MNLHLHGRQVIFNNYIDVGHNLYKIELNQYKINQYKINAINNKILQSI